MDSEKESAGVLENLLFPKIFKTFRMAIHPSKLIIAFLAVAVICLAGWIMDLTNTVVAVGDGATELHVYVNNPDRLQEFIEANEDQGERTGVFSTLWHFAREKFHGALYSLFAFNIPGVAVNITDYFRAVRWAVKYHTIYCIILVIIKLAVISLAGGAICRIAALQFARGEKPGLTEALRFSAKKFLTLFTVPLLPLAVIAVAALCVCLLGLIGTIPWVGELIMGLLIPLALLAGVLITAVLIGTAAGFNLMYPAVAYDDSDCFDAINRSFCYVYSRPWRMGFYTVVAAVYGAICYVFVRFLAFLLLWATQQSLHLGARFISWLLALCGVETQVLDKSAVIWPEPGFMNLLGSSALTPANWSQSIAAFLVYLVLLAVIALVLSFIISFYFSANTVIYALMRNRVDNTALEDVYTPSEETQTGPDITQPESEESQPRSQTQDK